VSEIVIRPSTAVDIDAVTRIYAWNVLHGSGTFEIEPPDRLEIERRRADVLAKGWPWLVLESAGAVAGYAYASPFRPRRPTASASRTRSTWPRKASAAASGGSSWPSSSPAARQPGRGRSWR
jgi:L-amino acid N-acyltransferase YncA